MVLELRPNSWEKLEARQDAVPPAIVFEAAPAATPAPAAVPAADPAVDPAAAAPAEQIVTATEPDAIVYVTSEVPAVAPVDPATVVPPPAEATLASDPGTLPPAVPVPEALPTTTAAPIEPLPAPLPEALPTSEPLPVEAAPTAEPSDIVPEATTSLDPILLATSEPLTTSTPEPDSTVILQMTSTQSSPTIATLSTHSRTSTTTSSTASATSAADTSSTEAQKRLVAPIAGGIGGAIALAGILVFFMLWCKRRRRHRRESMLTEKRAPFHRIESPVRVDLDQGVSQFDGSAHNHHDSGHGGGDMLDFGMFTRKSSRKTAFTGDRGLSKPDEEESFPMTVAPPRPPPHKYGADTDSTRGYFTDPTASTIIAPPAKLRLMNAQPGDVLSDSPGGTPRIRAASGFPPPRPPRSPETPQGAFGLTSSPLGYDSPSPYQDSPYNNAATPMLTANDAFHDNLTQIDTKSSYIPSYYHGRTGGDPKTSAHAASHSIDTTPSREHLLRNQSLRRETRPLSLSSSHYSRNSFYSDTSDSDTVRAERRARMRSDPFDLYIPRDVNWPPVPPVPAVPERSAERKTSFHRPF